MFQKIKKSQSAHKDKSQFNKDENLPSDLTDIQLQKINPNYKDDFQLFYTLYNEQITNKTQKTQSKKATKHKQKNTSIKQFKWKKFKKINSAKKQNELNYSEIKNTIKQEKLQDNEGIEEYQIGGYYPAHIGEIFFNRYILVKKLGYGNFSTVWLAKDIKHDIFVAIKIIKSEKQYKEQALDELELFQAINLESQQEQWQKQIQEYQLKFGQNVQNDNYCVKMLNFFLHKSYLGENYCFVFELLGQNFLQLLQKQNFKGFSLNFVISITRQILIGLQFLHKYAQIIHTDLKPDNILIQLTQEQQQYLGEKELLRQIFYLKKAKKMRQINKKTGKFIILDNKNWKKKIKNFNNQQKIPNTFKKICHQQQQNQLQQNQQVQNETSYQQIHIKIADLGNSCWINHHFSSYIQTRSYRAPEIILGLQYIQSTDIWSLGCIFYEFLTGVLLFQPQQGPGFDIDDDHLAQMEEILGKFPKNFSLIGEKSQQFYNKEGNLKRIKCLNKASLFELIQNKTQIDKQQVIEISVLLKKMLKPDPYQRLSADGLLNLDLFLSHKKKCTEKFFNRETNLKFINKQIDVQNNNKVQQIKKQSFSNIFSQSDISDIIKSFSSLSDIYGDVSSNDSQIKKEFQLKQKKIQLQNDGKKNCYQNQFFQSESILNQQLDKENFQSKDQHQSSQDSSDSDENFYDLKNFRKTEKIKFACIDKSFNKLYTNIGQQNIIDFQQIDQTDNYLNKNM